MIFIMAGTAKLTNANFENAWAIYLTKTEMPFSKFFFVIIPVFEIIVGVFLLLGYHSRIGAFLVLPLMVVAAYFHLTVGIPEVFIANPYVGLLPPFVIMMALTILIYGGGKWSLDLKSLKKDL